MGVQLPEIVFHRIFVPLNSPLEESHLDKKKFVGHSPIDLALTCLFRCIHDGPEESGSKGWATFRRTLFCFFLSIKHTSKDGEVASSAKR